MAETKVFVMPCGAIFARSDALKTEHIRTCAYCANIQASIATSVDVVPGSDA